MHPNVEAVKLLLADPRLNTHNHEDSNGKTPVMAAIICKKVNALRELVAHPSVDLDARDNWGNSLEDLARWELIWFLQLQLKTFVLFVAGARGMR